MAIAQAIPQRFGAMVAKARAGRRWSQSELAAILDLHVDKVRRLEKGEADPTLSLAVRTAALLDLELDRLLPARQTA